MKTKIIPTDNSDSIKIALSALKAGEVVVIPTDTVYGIACQVACQSAVERIYQIKGRDFSKALPVLISNYAQLPKITGSFPDAAKKIMDNFWPGALTLIVQKHPSLSKLITSLSTVGVRMPDHSWLLELINKSGPLAATSANISGSKSPASVKDVLEQLQGKVEHVFDGGPCKGGVASTVIDCTRPYPKILREGHISLEDIQRVLA